MECYLCGSEPTHQCPRCRRLYCDEHGGEYCADCLSPASALPSSAVYRGSILALLAGTVVALWLLIRPPGESNGSSGGTGSTIIVTPSVTRVVRPQATRTPSGSVTPGATSAATTPTTPGAESATPANGAETATPGPGETPAGPRTYVVVPGDTLWDIAGRYLPPGENLAAFAGRIAAANGLDPTTPALVPGQSLQIPQ